MGKKISKEEIEKLAKLAHISLTPKELESYTKEIEGILHYVDKLNEVDVSKVEYRPHIKLGNVYRQDKSEESLTQQEALSNRKKQSQKGYFRVQAVITK